MSDQDSGYDASTYNKTGFIVFVGSFGFSIALFIGLGYFYTMDPIDTIIDPPKDGEVVFNIATVENPWVSSEDMVAHGAKQYKSNCASCHGVKGLGDGIPDIKPRNLVAGQWTKGGDSISMYNTLKNGIEGSAMAAFGHLGTPTVWSLVHYVRSITENKVDDDAAAVEEFGKAQ